MQTHIVVTIDTPDNPVTHVEEQEREGRILNMIKIGLSAYTSPMNPVVAVELLGEKHCAWYNELGMVTQCAQVKGELRIYEDGSWDVEQETRKYDGDDLLSLARLIMRLSRKS